MLFWTLVWFFHIHKHQSIVITISIIMKKLILSVAMLLGSFVTFAQTDAKTVVQSATEMAKPTQDKFKEVKADEVPEAVSKSLAKAYPEAKVDKAFVNDQKEYKLDIAVGDQKATVFADANGNWIKR